ncbi:MAG: hypothetical protein K0A94_08020 [Desulfuromonadales bacterium]|nr:hypothetical protein [Desulfuromonadales bacterium]
MEKKKSINLKTKKKIKKSKKNTVVEKNTVISEEDVEQEKLIFLKKIISAKVLNKPLPKRSPSFLRIKKEGYIIWAKAQPLYQELIEELKIKKKS